MNYYALIPWTDGQTLYRISGFLDTDKIHPDACPALVADVSAGEQGIIALAFGVSFYSSTWSLF